MAEKLLRCPDFRVWKRKITEHDDPKETKMDLQRKQTQQHH